MENIKIKLATLNFLEFAVWGSYLVSMGMYLSSVGLTDNIYWFYTVQGLVSLFMPALFGIIADKWIPAQKMLSLSHLFAGGFMIAAGWYCHTAGDAVEFSNLFIYYTLSVAFFMPTVGLNNSVAFNALRGAGYDTVKAFPPIRTMGTIGFIVAELFVNFTGYQHTYAQFFTSGVISMMMCAYSLTMPECPVNKKKHTSLADSLGLTAFKLFKRKKMAMFFIFSMLLGVSLQITNSYGSVYISLFGEEMKDNATAITAISQGSEALFILAIPICLKYLKIKGVIFTAMIGWVLRFGLFGIGGSGSDLIWIILSCIVYGVAFDFFNVSGGLFVDKETDSSMRSSAQGLFMLMTNGIGASIGTWVAGNFVVNKLVDSTAAVDIQIAGWRECWFIFAGYALVVAILFWFIFNDKEENNKRLKESESSVAKINS